MAPALDPAALDQLFTAARTHRHWLPEAVAEDELRRVWELARMGPTEANCSPLRIVLVVSAEAKERLKPALDSGNVAKAMSAPATAIFAFDTRFYELMPTLAPGTADATTWFAGREEAAARRSATLQAAYFILAARALGLDLGPMGGFDAAAVDRDFFPDGRWRSLFLCNIGHGDPARVRPRAPRLSFDEACRML
jgi:3-hydroxypropanoate dehydrogenase